MIRRYMTMAAFGFLALGLGLFSVGCSESPPPATASQPAASEEPAEPLTAAEKRERQREFDNMGIAEKREWRRKQREAGGADAP